MSGRGSARPAAAQSPLPRHAAAHCRLGDERGFTLIEVLVACLVLAVGLLGLFGALNVATQTTGADRQRQAETSLAREVIEDARSLAYTQLTPTALAGALQPVMTGSTVSGQGLSVARSGSTLNVSLNVCSLDDPTDGYGDHSSPPASGGVWCPDVAPSGTVDSNPDDEKRLSVTITPRSGSQPTVQLSTLIYGHLTNGPAVSCMTTTQGSCPGANQSLGPSAATTLTFYVTTTTQAASLTWLVNGGAPPNAQIGGGASSNTYVPSSTGSQFTWVIPTRSDGTSIDGTYTISVYAQDSNGATGTRSTLQVSVNEHSAVAPPGVAAGYDPLICITGGGLCPAGQVGGVDIQWQPSTDQDVIYYNVVRTVGTTTTTVCSHVTGTSCTDLTASNPGTPPSSCANPPTDYASQPAYYAVIPFDTYNGSPRAGTPSSPSVDADLCDHAPSAPTNLTLTASNGAVTLNWTAPSGSGDPDPGDSIQGWRIYRWASGTSASDPGSRLTYIGTSSGNPVTSFTDNSADPGGITQSYCVTSVDTHLDESTCSNLATG